MRISQLKMRISRWMKIIKKRWKIKNLLIGPITSGTYVKDLKINNNPKISTCLRQWKRLVRVMDSRCKELIYSMKHKIGQRLA